ncbi:MAG TPA: ArsA family ATPase [Gemmatimonadales bacterium]|jgi:energy-coupling factor transporter ATP-binding protein EcfA2|nr:ArsA family ATPase [Gemmatimonadales bacterium]
MSSPAALLLSRQLIVVTGKGGVGKTTLTALLGRALAARGRRVLLLETDPRESLHQLLGTEPSGGRLLEAGPGLWFQNLDPRAVVEGLVREKIPVAAIARRVIASPLFQHFAAGAPGLKEMATLGHALRAVRGPGRPRLDVVVLDAPATGHGVSMLNAPLLLEDAVRGGELGAMAAELAAWIADPAHCAVAIATVAEELPVQEATELIGLLRREPAVVVVNALYPPLPRPLPAERGDLAPFIDRWRRRRELNERELRRLRAAWRGPMLALPLLPLPRGPALLDGLGAVFERELAGVPIS